jgi:putative sugar O-methyltransferase
MTVEVSKLWKALCADMFATTDEEFLQSFRKPGGANSRLAAWDPLDPTMRYFKFLLYTTAERQVERFFALYRKLGDVSIGSPVSVRVRSCDINLDYFLAVDEFLFIESVIEREAVRSIVEIGAGFGRTCHALIALKAGHIDSYCIVDLPEILELSRRVLARAVPDHFDRIRFIDATDESTWKGLKADLVINIDSFQEMPPETIDQYKRGLISGARFFYIKNPIGKYDPQSIGLEALTPEKTQDVFSLGYCRDVIDIFNDAALVQARSFYLQAYRPGADWTLEADKPMQLFPYYHHALFRKRHSER